MPVASIKNKSGNYISPSIEAVSKAANTTIPTDTRASITNTNAKDGYPISGFTWILAFQDQSINNRTKEQALATQKMLTWMITQGQQYTQPSQTPQASSDDVPPQTPAQSCIQEVSTSVTQFPH